MDLRRIVMRLLGTTPQSPEPSPHTRESQELEGELYNAVERQKAATSDVIQSSLNQVTRASDVTVAVRSIVSRIEQHDMGLRTARGALDLVERHWL